MASVEFRNVVKRYSDHTVISKLNLFIPDGKFVVLVGPSGCGKSTTLRMIAGLEDITEGDLFIGERRVNDVLPRDRDIAMVFQNYALYPHMTVRDNLSFGLRLRRIPPSEIEKRVADAAEMLGLQEYLDRRPSQLSGGQRQRVAMGRALVRRPQVFLFDEPLSNLDAKLRGEMRREIARLHHRLQTTMVYVTHDQVEAMTLADIMVVMEKGRIRQVGNPMDVYSQPADAFTAAFIGSPTINLLPVEVRTGEVERITTIEGQGFSLQVTARFMHYQGDGLMGIRPGDVRLSSDTGNLQGRIDVMEPLGHRVLYTVDTPAGSVLCELDASEARWKPGDAVHVVFPMELVHLFEADGDQKSLLLEGGTI